MSKNRPILILLVLSFLAIAISASWIFPKGWLTAIYLRVDKNWSPDKISVVKTIGDAIVKRIDNQTVTTGSLPLDLTFMQAEINDFDRRMPEHFSGWKYRVLNGGNHYELYTAMTPKAYVLLVYDSKEKRWLERD